MSALEKAKSYRHFAAGKTVVMEGFEMPFMASIVEGVACVRRGMEDGRTQIVGLLFPSDFIGHPSRVISTHMIEAVTDLDLCCFKTIVFQKLASQMPRMAQRLLIMKLDELDAARDWMLLLGRKNVRERFASFLILLARRQKGNKPLHKQNAVLVDMILSQRLIAEFLGLTHETISRQMHCLRDEGFIDFKSTRQVSILDLQALYALSGEDDDGGIVA